MLSRQRENESGRELISFNDQVVATLELYVRRLQAAAPSDVPRVFRSIEIELQASSDVIPFVADALLGSPYCPAHKRRHGPLHTLSAASRNTARWHASRELRLKTRIQTRWGLSIMRAYGWDKWKRAGLAPLCQVAEQFPDWSEAVLLFNSVLIARHEAVLLGHKDSRQWFGLGATETPITPLDALNVERWQKTQSFSIGGRTLQTIDAELPRIERWATGIPDDIRRVNPNAPELERDCNGLLVPLAVKRKYDVLQTSKNLYSNLKCNSKRARVETASPSDHGTRRGNSPFTDLLQEVRPLQDVHTVKSPLATQHSSHSSSVVDSFELEEPSSRPSSTTTGPQEISEHSFTQMSPQSLPSVTGTRSSAPSSPLPASSKIPRQSSQRSSISSSRSTVVATAPLFSSLVPASSNTTEPSPQPSSVRFSPSTAPSTSPPASLLPVPSLPPHLQSALPESCGSADSSSRLSSVLSSPLSARDTLSPPLPLLNAPGTSKSPPLILPSTPSSSETIADATLSRNTDTRIQTSLPQSSTLTVRDEIRESTEPHAKLSATIDTVSAPLSSLASCPLQPISGLALSVQGPCGPPSDATPCDALIHADSLAAASSTICANPTSNGSLDSSDCPMCNGNCVAGVVPPEYGEPSTRKQMFEALHKIIDTMEKSSSNYLGEVKLEWARHLRYGTIFYDPSILGSSNCSKDDAEFWCLDEITFAQYVDAGMAFDRPIIIKEAFKDSGKYDLERCISDYCDRIDGKVIESRNQQTGVMEFLAAKDLAQHLLFPTSAFNALNLGPWIDAEKPVFTRSKRFRLLTLLIDRIRACREPGKQTTLESYDLAGCTHFGLASVAGAFSGAHVDALCGTWIRMLCGEKAWTIVPSSLMKESDWEEFNQLGDHWTPKNKSRVMILQPDMILYMPGLFIHQVFTIQSSVTEGGMVWDEEDILQLTDDLFWVGKNQNATNEAIQDQLHLVLAELDRFVQSNPGRFTDGDVATFLRSFAVRMKRLDGLRCNCAPRCTNGCPCLIDARRCTLGCNGHKPSRNKCMKDSQGA